jgi:hypothetical protein
VVDKLNKIIVNDTLEFLKEKLVLPLLDVSFKNYDERCYSVFTKELADILENEAPGYFETDYISKIGQYYFRSLYDSYVPEEILIEIVKAEEDDRLEGLKIFFADTGFKVMNNVIEDSVRDLTLKFDHIDELMHLIILKELNKIS